MKRVRAGFFTSLVIILLVEIALITQTLFYPQKTRRAFLPTPIANITPTSTQKFYANNTTPELQLYPQFVWTKTSKSDKKAISNTAGTLLYKNAGDPVNITFSGVEWSTVQKISNDKELGTVYTAFSKFYDTQLTSSGWKQKTEVASTPFESIATDGPTGSMWGYVKVENEKLQLVVLSEEIYSAKETDPPTCPCTVTYRVFITNPTPTANLISKN